MQGEVKVADEAVVRDVMALVATIGALAARLGVDPDQMMMFSKPLGGEAQVESVGAVMLRVCRWAGIGDVGEMTGEERAEVEKAKDELLRAADLMRREGGHG